MSITITSEKVFSTSDITLATTLSLWYPIESIDRTNPKRAIFIFVCDDKLNQLIQNYWKKEVLVEPRQYFDQLKAIKNRLYATRE